MTTDKHSPTPWEYNKDVDGGQVSGRRGAEITRNGFSIGAWFDASWDGTCPNSDFIIRACNCHESVTDYLRQFVGAAEMVIDSWEHGDLAGAVNMLDCLLREIQDSGVLRAS